MDKMNSNQQSLGLFDEKDFVSDVTHTDSLSHDINKKMNCMTELHLTGILPTKHAKIPLISRTVIIGIPQNTYRSWQGASLRSILVLATLFLTPFVDAEQPLLNPLSLEEILLART